MLLRCTTILIGIMSTELTRIMCQILAEQDLIIRERMKNDMAKSAKTYEERIRALEKRNRKASSYQKLIAQRKELEREESRGK